MKLTRLFLLLTLLLSCQKALTWTCIDWVRHVNSLLHIGTAAEPSAAHAQSPWLDLFVWAKPNPNPRLVSRWALVQQLSFFFVGRGGGVQQLFYYYFKKKSELLGLSRERELPNSLLKKICWDLLCFGWACQSPTCNKRKKKREPLVSSQQEPGCSLGLQLNKNN